jgi:hypothetical protein
LRRTKCGKTGDGQKNYRDPAGKKRITPQTHIFSDSARGCPVHLNI